MNRNWICLTFCIFSTLTWSLVIYYPEQITSPSWLRQLIQIQLKSKVRKRLFLFHIHYVNILISTCAYAVFICDFFLPFSGMMLPDKSAESLTFTDHFTCQNTPWKCLSVCLIFPPFSPDSSNAFLPLSGLFPPSFVLHSLAFLMFQGKLVNLGLRWNPEDLQVTNLCCTLNEHKTALNITLCFFIYSPMSSWDPEKKVLIFRFSVEFKYCAWKKHITAKKKK